MTTTTYEMVSDDPQTAGEWTATLDAADGRVTITDPEGVVAGRGWWRFDERGEGHVDDCDAALALGGDETARIYAGLERALVAAAPEICACPDCDGPADGTDDGGCPTCDACRDYTLDANGDVVCPEHADAAGYVDSIRAAGWFAADVDVDTVIAVVEAACEGQVLVTPDGRAEWTTAGAWLDVPRHLRVHVPRGGFASAAQAAAALADVLEENATARAWEAARGYDDDDEAAP